MKKEKIKVIIVSGEYVENYFGVKKAVYPFENQKKDISDIVKNVLNDGEDEKITIQIKKVRKSWLESLKEID